MTGEELLIYIRKKRISRLDLAEYFDVDYRTMNRWINGETPVPRMVEIIIEADIIKTVEKTSKKPV